MTRRIILCLSLALLVKAQNELIPGNSPGGTGGGGGHTQNTDIGTTAPSFQIDTNNNGSRIKNVVGGVGGFSFRNGADTGDATMNFGTGLIDMRTAKVMSARMNAPLPPAGLNADMQWIVLGVSGPGLCTGTGSYNALCRSDGATWQFIANVGNDPAGSWIDGQSVLAAGTTGRGWRPASFTGMVKYTSGVPSLITGSPGDYIHVDGTTGPGGTGGSVSGASICANSSGTGGYITTAVNGTICEFSWSLLPLQAAAVTWSGQHSYPQSTTQPLGSAAVTIDPNGGTVVIAPDANRTLISAPTIANGASAGHRFILCNFNLTFAATLQDEANLANSNIRNGGANLVLGGASNQPCAMLEYINSEWQVIGTKPGGGSSSGMGDPGGNGIMVRTALNTSVPRQITCSPALSCSNGTGVSGDPYIDVPETSASGGIWAYWESLDVAFNSGGASSIGTAVNQMVCMPRYMRYKLTYTRMAFYVQTLAAGKHAAAGLYDPVSLALIAQTGEKPTDAVGAQFGNFAAKTTGPGWVAVCLAADDTVQKFGGANNGNGFGAAWDISTNGVAFRVNTTGYVAGQGLPPTLAGWVRTTGGVAAMPYVWIGN